MSSLKNKTIDKLHSEHNSMLVQVPAEFNQCISGRRISSIRQPTLSSSLLGKYRLKIRWFLTDQLKHKIELISSLSRNAQIAKRNLGGGVRGVRVRRSGVPPLLKVVYSPKVGVQVLLHSILTTRILSLSIHNFTSPIQVLWAWCRKKDEQRRWQRPAFACLLLIKQWSKNCSVNPSHHV